MIKNFICSVINPVLLYPLCSNNSPQNLSTLYHFMILILTYKSIPKHIVPICLFSRFLQILLFYMQFSLTWFSHSILIQRCIPVHSLELLYIIPLCEYTINYICMLLLAYICDFPTFVFFSLGTKLLSSMNIYKSFSRIYKQEWKYKVIMFNCIK